MLGASRRPGKSPANKVTSKYRNTRANPAECGRCVLLQFGVAEPVGDRVARLVWELAQAVEAHREHAHAADRLLGLEGGAA